MFRKYDPDRDREAVHRIWIETGWIEPSNYEPMDIRVDSSYALVAELNNSPECLVICHGGTMQYLDEELPYAGITGVITSRLARKQRFASQLTAKAIADNATRGNAVSGLCMFEQGYYDRLGMGTGCYEHHRSFEPATLKVSMIPRVPVRITQDDWAMVHASRVARRRRHGALVLEPAEITRSIMAWSKNGFGLGYLNSTGDLYTHFCWVNPENVNSGPYNISMFIYNTREEFLELLALLKSLGDQVWYMRMREPQDIIMQDLIRSPIKSFHASRNNNHTSRMGTEALAYWQARMLDLPACLAKTHLNCAAVDFNLVITDPITRYLDESPWQGINGEFQVHLGEECTATPGTSPALPTLTTTVNCFTRLWLGACPASGLTYSDTLEGPDTLIAALDTAFRLPKPSIDWEGL